MSECLSAEMRDALPDYLNGTLHAARTVEVRAHVAACDECAAELELLRIVAASAPSAPAMDFERIANAIPTPTKHGFMIHRGGDGVTRAETPTILPIKSRPRRIWSRPSVKIAAGLAIVTAGGLSLLVGRDVLRPESEVGQAKPVPVAAAGITPSVSTPVAPTNVAPAPQSQPRQVASAEPAQLSLTGDLQELSDEHIATLLNEMDRMDGLPSSEPDAVEPVVTTSNSGGMNQ
ncbi:MAG: anti-sigma factor [Gemmatimonadaceae bacterium]